MVILPPVLIEIRDRGLRFPDAAKPGNRLGIRNQRGRPSLQRRVQAIQSLTSACEEPIETGRLPRNPSLPLHGRLWFRLLPLRRALHSGGTFGKEIVLPFDQKREALSIRLSTL